MSDEKPATPRAKPLYGPHFWIGMTLTAGVFGFMGMLFYVPIPESNQRISDIMFGSIGTAWIGSMAYWFNHTRSSDNKTDLLSKAPPIKEE